MAQGVCVLCIGGGLEGGGHGGDLEVILAQGWEKATVHTIEWNATKEVTGVTAPHSLLGTTFELGGQPGETKGRQRCVRLSNGF